MKRMNRKNKIKMTDGNVLYWMERSSIWVCD